MNKPILSQLKGLLRFHKAAYKAYKASGQTKQAQAARKAAISIYLQIRSLR